MKKIINLFVFVLFINCGTLYKNKMNNQDKNDDNSVIKEINFTPNGQNSLKKNIVKNNGIKKGNSQSSIKRNIKLNSYFSNFIIQWGKQNEINLDKVPYDILILIDYFYDINSDFIEKAAIQDSNNSLYTHSRSR